MGYNVLCYKSLTNRNSKIYSKSTASFTPQVYIKSKACNKSTQLVDT